ncbi:hypothetical protein N8463_02580 [Synechococcus sp. AH-601-P06]|nr:hypothetical protein [Synechococcus sp. AH-601-P06]
MHQKFRYIKLGKAGDREANCIKDGKCFIGFMSGDDQYFNTCVKAAKDKNDQLWESIRQDLISSSQAPESRQSKQAATSSINQVRSFYESDIETTWITFHAGKLFWARLDPGKPPTQVTGGSTRDTLDGWSCMANQDELKIESLSGSLTKLMMFRGTSCDLDETTEGYLRRRLTGEQQPHIKQIQEGRAELEKGVREAIKTLTPQDFELLTELIFSKTLRRVSSTGKVQKYVDIVFENPLTLTGLGDHDPICVQVKSETSSKQLKEYLENEERQRFSAFYYVYHTSRDQVDEVGIHAEYPDENIYLLDVDKVATLAIDNGLLTWIINKSD